MQKIKINNQRRFALIVSFICMAAFILIAIAVPASLSANAANGSYNLTAEKNGKYLERLTCQDTETVDRVFFSFYLGTYDTYQNTVTNGEPVCETYNGQPHTMTMAEILEATTSEYTWQDGFYTAICDVRWYDGSTYKFFHCLEVVNFYYDANYADGGIDLPPDPEKTGYDFIGWFYDAALTIPYQGEPITGDTDLYAKFIPTEYTITYNLNGGTLTNGWNNYNIESATYTLPIPTRNYYTFDGWYTNSGFSGSPVTIITNGSYGDKSFYAKYTPITYTITYELNGGTMTGQPVSYNVESSVINLPTAYKNGYIFGGWYTSATFSGSPISTIPTGSNGDKIFYAKYTPVEYSITYYLNGGTLTGQQVTYNTESETYTLPTPTLMGFNFKGWYTDASFTGSAVTSIMQGSIGNKVFYAKWEIITYTVTFYVDGVIYKQLTVNYGSVLNGFYFADSQMESVAFYADPALTAKYNLGAEIYTDTIIFANTDFDLYVSLTYSVNGMEMTTDLLEYNTLLVNLRTYEIEGYNFGGWFYDKAFSKPILATDKITSNITIYAKLTETETQNTSFMKKIGTWFSSSAGIAVICIVAVALVIGGVYAVRKKKKA